MKSVVWLQWRQPIAVNTIHMTHPIKIIYNITSRILGFSRVLYTQLDLQNLIKKEKMWIKDNELKINQEKLQ